MESEIKQKKSSDGKIKATTRDNAPRLWLPGTVSGKRIIWSRNRIEHSGNSGNRIGHGLSMFIFLSV